MDELETLFINLGVQKTYVQQGLQGIASRHRLFKTLLSSRELPERGWDDLNIELLLAELAAMDSNNFPHNIGAGEREGRVFSGLVSRRHHRLSHGVGRSGDLAEVQPKAAGSSIISKLTTCLLLNAIKICGLTHIRHVQIMPLATGMTLMMCMLALKSKNPAGKYVIWPRIDQKSCFKSIVSANLIPLVVENILLHDELVTDMESIEELLKAHGKEVLCVLATTSCFAPRNPDKIDKIAILCKTYGIPQVVNNAYGVQCRSICKLINRAMTVGRVDYVISSLDKNFLVPVGGAFIGAITAEDVALVSRFYPGRASLGPTLDLFITLLSMGKQQLLSLLHTREELMLRLVEGTDAIAATYGERRLVTTCNPISIALSLNSIASSPYDATFLGSMLFQRCVSGVRVVPLGAEATVSGHVFVGWGAQCRSYHCSYMTVACALGMTADEVTAFLEKLGKIFAQLKSKASNKAP